MTRVVLEKLASVGSFESATIGFGREFDDGAGGTARFVAVTTLHCVLEVSSGR